MSRVIIRKTKIEMDECLYRSLGSPPRVFVVMFGKDIYIMAGVSYIVHTVKMVPHIVLHKATVNENFLKGEYPAELAMFHGSYAIHVQNCVNRVHLEFTCLRSVSASGGGPRKLRRSGATGPSNDTVS